MTLGDKQRLFSRFFVQLLRYIHQHGHEVVIGEVFRPPEQAQRMADLGKGIVNSNHTRCLAVDLSLFLNGKYLTDCDDYEFAGKYWEKLGTGKGVETIWGGRWKSRDGVHFSIKHGGVG